MTRVANTLVVVGGLLIVIGIHGIIGGRRRAGAGHMAIASGTGSSSSFVGNIPFAASSAQVLGCYHTTAGDTTMHLAIGGNDMGLITQAECDEIGRIINRVKGRTK